PALFTGLNPLVVVVDRHRQRPLGGVLPDDVALEELPDLHRLGEFVEFHVVGVGELLFDDLVAEIDALIADVHTGASDELLHLLLALPTERALQQVPAVSDARHGAEGLLPIRRWSSLSPHVFTDATRLIGPAATINAESRPWYLRELMPHSLWRKDIARRCPSLANDALSVSLACRGCNAIESGGRQILPPVEVSTQPERSHEDRRTPKKSPYRGHVG